MIVPIIAVIWREDLKFPEQDFKMRNAGTDVYPNPSMAKKAKNLRKLLVYILNGLHLAVGGHCSLHLSDVWPKNAYQQ